MFKRAWLLALLLVGAFVFTACAYDGSITITTSQTSFPGYSGGYSGPGQTGTVGTSSPLGSGQQSSDSLLMYQDYYYFDQGGQSVTGPTQYGSQPTYLIINGQSRPYDPSYVSSNSLWIQGKTSWTQYIKCPLNAWYRVLAFSNGGPATMVETYPTGYQDVKNYNFYQGYTPGVFEADTQGRHVLSFYINGQKSNTIIVDVVAYSGTTLVNNPPSGQVPGQIQCDITGTWNFGTNGPYNIINADGTIVAKNTLEGEIFDSGTWHVIDALKRQYGFTWQSGWAHTFTLSADCSTLDGTGRLNGGTEQPDHATRVTSGQTTTKTVIINVGTNSQQSGQQGNGCDITGTWNFGTNGPYNIINADGTIVAKNTLGGEIFDTGTWRVIDASERLYGFTWQSGWAHTFTLSADCSALDGSGRLNGGTEQPGHATRVASGTSTGNIGQNSGQTSSTGSCTCPPGKIQCPGFPEQYWSSIYAYEMQTYGESYNCTCDCSGLPPSIGSNPFSTPPGI